MSWEKTEKCKIDDSNCATYFGSSELRTAAYPGCEMRMILLGCSLSVLQWVCGLWAVPEPEEKPLSAAGARSIWVETLLCEIPDHHWHEVMLPSYLKLDAVASIFNLLHQVFTVFFQSEEVKLPSYYKQHVDCFKLSQTSEHAEGVWQECQLLPPFAPSFTACS